MAVERKLEWACLIGKVIHLQHSSSAARLSSLLLLTGSASAAVMLNPGREMLGRVDLCLHTNCFCSLQEILSKVNSLIVSMGQLPILNLFLMYHLVLLRTLGPWQAVLFIGGSLPLRPQMVTLGSADATCAAPYRSYHCCYGKPRQAVEPWHLPALEN